jgi:hypothetical protein
MSTSVTRGGAGLGTGRGRFIGVLAVGLAVIIALGVVWAVNQGREDTFTEPIVVNQTGHPGANIERYKMGLAGQLAVAPSPGANIERYKMGLAGQLAVAPSPGTNPEAYKMDLEFGLAPVVSPGVNPEAYKMSLVAAQRAQEIWAERYQTQVEMQSEKWLAQQAIWDQRYQDMVDRFENQSSDIAGQRLIHDRLEEQR